MRRRTRWGEDSRAASCAAPPPCSSCHRTPMRARSQADTTASPTPSRPCCTPRLPSSICRGMGCGMEGNRMKSESSSYESKLPSLMNSDPKGSAVEKGCRRKKLLKCSHDKLL